MINEDKKTKGKKTKSPEEIELAKCKKDLERVDKLMYDAQRPWGEGDPHYLPFLAANRDTIASRIKQLEIAVRILKKTN